MFNINERHHGVLRPCQRIVQLYRNRNLRRDEMKDGVPFRHTLAGLAMVWGSVVSDDNKTRYV